MNVLKRTTTTECTIPFEFEWTINNYFPERLVSLDFSHPFFTKDVWFLRLDPPPSPYVTSEAIITIVPKSESHLRIGLKVKWNEEVLVRTVIEPSRGAICAKYRVENGYERLVTTSFTIRCTLCYPTSIVSSLEPLLPSLEDDVSKLLKDLAIQRDKQLAGDFVLTSGDEEGKSVSVHALVLASRSSVFRAMLSMDSEEKRNRRVVLKATPSTVLIPFVDFLYADKIAWASINFKTAVDLFLFADQYDIRGLRKMTEAFISCNIRSPSDAELVRQLVSKIDSEPIQGALRLYDSRNEES